MGHAPANLAFATVLTSSFTLLAFSKYRWAQIASLTDSLRHNVSAPWSLYGEVYVSEPEGHETSDRWFLFEMHGTPHEAKTYPAESDVPTQAIHSALGLSEDATLECLGVWQMPSVAP